MFRNNFSSRASTTPEVARPQRPAAHGQPEQPPQALQMAEEGPRQDVVSLSRQASLESERLPETTVAPEPVVLTKAEMLQQRIALATEMDQLQKQNQRLKKWDEAKAARYYEAKQLFEYLGKAKKNPNLQIEKPFEPNYEQIARAVERDRPKTKAEAKAEFSARILAAQEKLNLQRAGLLPARQRPAVARQVVEAIPVQVAAPTAQLAVKAPDPELDDLKARLQALRSS